MAFIAASPQTTSTFLPSPVSHYPPLHERERERLMRWLQTAPVSAPTGVCAGISGGPGIGKTVLALDVARTLQTQRVLPLILVYAQERRADHALREAILRLHPGAPALPPDRLHQQFQETLAASPAIVVLDGVIEPDRAGRLAPPGSVLLITSRESMHTPSVELQPMDAASAHALLLAQSGANPNDAALPEICALVANNLLALRLIAIQLRRAPHMLPREIARGLFDEQQRLLRMAVRDGLRLAVDTAVAFIYHRLSVARQRVLRQLSVVTPAFDSALACAVCDTDPGTIAALAGLGLIESDIGTGRYRWQEHVRGFLRMRLSNSEGQQAELRYAEFAAARAADLASQTARDGALASLRDFDALRPHAEAVFARLRPDSHAFRARAARCQIALSRGLSELLPHRLTESERANWLRAEANAHRLLQDARGEARALGQLALSHIVRDDVDGALGCYERLMTLREALGGPAPQL
jgi:hypothetical protein